MYFKYGSYKHADNEVDITSFHIQRMYSPRNRMTFDRHTLILQGHLLADTQAELRTAIEALGAAYDRDYYDAGLYHDDGVRSAHGLDNSSSINGVRVHGLSYPNGGDGEYATGRTYSITLQADYLNLEDSIYSFEESIHLVGTGGPRWELVPRPRGLPIPLMVNEITPQYIVQQGEAIGWQAQPILPPPMLPEDWEHRDRRMVVVRSPQLIGRHGKYMWPIRWRYSFSTMAPLNIVMARPDYPNR
jgi:hypothetical protein